MPAYEIIYSNQKKVQLKTETVFMKTLNGAKTSAWVHAPEFTYRIDIKNLMGHLLTFNENETRWQNQALLQILPL